MRQREDPMSSPYATGRFADLAGQDQVATSVDVAASGYE
jgi:hypothetical protein